MSLASEPTNSETIRSLRRQLRRIEQTKHAVDSVPVTSGCDALDRLLPDGGFHRGTLVQWLAGGQGSGAGTLAMIAAREACRESGTLVVMDRERKFYPPAAAALGIDLNKVVVVQPRDRQDELWALDQALRCQAVSAVWAPIGQLDQRWFRRLQLAAETSGNLGLLLTKVSGAFSLLPTWAEVQLLVEKGDRSNLCEAPCGPFRQIGPVPFFNRRLQVRLTRCRGGVAGGRVELEIDETTGVLSQVSTSHETHSVHLASQLARPAIGRRATGT